MKKLILLGIVFILLSCSVFAANSTPNNISYDCTGLDPLAADRHFKLDETSGTLAEDSCVGANDGSAIGDWKTAKIANGLYSDAINDGLNTSYSPVGDSPFTICMWINSSNSDANWDRILTSGVLGGAGFIYFFLHTWNTNDIRLQLDDNIGQTTASWTGAWAKISGNRPQFHNLCFSAGDDYFQATNFNLFVDGVRQINNGGDNSAGAAVDYGSIFVSSANNSEATWSLDSAIDEILIMGHNITEQQAYDINLSDWTVVAGDTTAPNINQINFTSDGGAVCTWPTSCATTTDRTPSYDLTTDENARCRISTINQSYDNMIIDCTGNDTTLLSCTQPEDFQKGSFANFFACTDDTGNNHTVLDSTNVANITIDTCPYISGNWLLLARDECVIDTNTDVGGNNISIEGTGTTTLLANITGFTELMIRGNSSIARAIVRCSRGNCFK